MPKVSVIAAVLVAVGLLASGAHSIQKVSRSGRYLYTADGSRFYIRGIAYQEQGAVSTNANNPFEEPDSFIDPLANGTACERDLTYLQQLDINTIRVYSVDSTLNHDACMNAFSNANIYTIIDLSLPVNGSINRDTPSWTTNLLDQYINTINVFSKYDNVLAYNVGNEVVIAANETSTAAFVKAAARDTRAYLASVSSSALVGYAAIDGVSDWVAPLANYLSCDPSNTNSDATAIDIFGLNNYEWCGDATASVYDNTNGEFAGYNVAAYFSEFGCVTSPPRLWTEVQALFSSPMTNIWSGGIAFSYFPATSSAGEFGIVNITANGSVATTADFTRLVTQYGEISPPNSPSQSSAGSSSYPACPQQNSTFLASTTIPSTPNDAACSCLENELSCQFTPQTSNTSTIIGNLINEACGLLAAQGGNCNDIASNGSTGVYGRVSGCNPSVELSYIMSEFYEATNRNAQSCSFGGNATINSKAPSGVSASAAASSCLSNPSATFTPSAPSTTPSSSSGSGSGSGSSGSGSKSAGARLSSNHQVLLGIVLAGLCSIAGGVLTLL
ncbi:1,3-beta-glucanosyltransferase gel4 [Sparassis crispa]|uniref:1,3-beta-glucanosyltransferase n=1 Tax=Sparassis crispa TaxID=139825 RepID=A0A401G8E5_9APHY|nr:1,3-beta-glucanosyltransferase gel4 [Sparassis crispa]GBE78403.1 1,3-beta-glucanosyltransferase gel4 [Sparassis crispa]